METMMTTDDYKFAIKKLVKLMNKDSMTSVEQNELERLLDDIDHYNGMEFFKIQNN
jgi:hypothetical protein